jgi:hypothetical protein
LLKQIGYLYVRMKKMVRYSLIGVLLGCAVLRLPAQNKSREEALIRKARLASNEAFRQHNYDGISRYLVKTVTVVSASGQILSGSDSVIGTLKRRFEQTPALYYERIPMEIEIEANDTLAWEKGQWSSYGLPENSRGKYSAGWCRRKGVWLIRSEVFVPSN